MRKAEFHQLLLYSMQQSSNKTASTHNGSYHHKANYNYILSKYYAEH